MAALDDCPNWLSVGVVAVVLLLSVMSWFPFGWCWLGRYPEGWPSRDLGGLMV
jgi:hypothetical protein